MQDTVNVITTLTSSRQKKRNLNGGDNPVARLPDVMHEPNGFQWGVLTRDDGATLRWGKLEHGNPWLECVLVGGFCEFIEKYFETIYDLHARGITVWCFDWRGQGASDRLEIDTVRPAPRDFTRDANDLVAMTGMMGPKRRPRILIGHSMGAAIGIQVLKTDPAVFDAAVFSAPMINVATNSIPHGIALAMTRLANALGLSRTLIPGLSVLPMNGDVTPQTSATSHDPVRCTLMNAWFRANPKLRIDGVTFGWYHSALQFGDAFESYETFSTVTTPILLGVAGADQFVKTPPIYAFARQLPRCTLAEFPTAKHELFHEHDDIRLRWLSAIDTFLTSHFPKSRA